jgi:hypothetical protein
MAMSADPHAHLATIQADLAVGGLEGGLDGLASAGDLRQIGQRCRFVGVGHRPPPFRPLYYTSTSEIFVGIGFFCRVKELRTTLRK